METIKICEETPYAIQKVGIELEKLRESWLLSEAHYENEEGKKEISLKAEFSDLKATEIKSRIKADDELYKMRLAVIVAESKYRVKDKEYDFLKEELNAAKAILKAGG